MFYGNTARLYLINIIYTGYIITYEEVIYFEIKRTLPSIYSKILKSLFQTY